MDFEEVRVATLAARAAILAHTGEKDYWMSRLWKEFARILADVLFDGRSNKTEREFIETMFPEMPSEGIDVLWAAMEKVLKYHDEEMKET